MNPGDRAYLRRVRPAWERRFLALAASSALMAAEVVVPATASATRVPDQKPGGGVASPKPGALATSNLRFSLPIHSSANPSAPEDQRLQRLRKLSQSTNSLVELARELESILGSDAEGSVKSEARKMALLELAHHEEMAAGAGVRDGHLERALQLFAEFLQLYPSDHLVPEVLLQQGNIHRRLGLSDQALDFFYKAMRVANKMETTDLDHLRRLVLMAQSEIADTEAEAGRHAAAADLYQRILRGRTEELNVEVLLLKCLRSLSAAGDFSVIDPNATRFLNEFPDSQHVAEVRYLLAEALAKGGKEQAAQHQLEMLLEAVETAPPDQQARWAPWRLRVGNDLANQLYLRKDYTNAVLMYRSLLPAATNSTWRHPVLYQIGLCEEQLGRRAEARVAYSEITQDSVATLTPAVKLLQDMARLRIRILQGVEASLQLKQREVTP